MQLSRGETVLLTDRGEPIVQITAIVEPFTVRRQVSHAATPRLG